MKFVEGTLRLVGSGKVIREVGVSVTMEGEDVPSWSIGAGAEGFGLKILHAEAERIRRMIVNHCMVIYHRAFEICRIVLNSSMMWVYALRSITSLLPWKTNIDGEVESYSAREQHLTLVIITIWRDGV